MLYIFFGRTKGTTVMEVRNWVGTEGARDWGLIFMWS